MYAKLKEIKTKRVWHLNDVRKLCIRHDYYTRGTNEDYSAMLNFVSTSAPTKRNVYKVAEDIMKHSSGRESWCTDALCCIMYDLEKEAISTLHYVPCK